MWRWKSPNKHSNSSRSFGFSCKTVCWPDKKSGSGTSNTVPGCVKVTFSDVHTFYMQWAVIAREIINNFLGNVLSFLHSVSFRHSIECLCWASERMYCVAGCMAANGLLSMLRVVLNALWHGEAVIQWQLLFEKPHEYIYMECRWANVFSVAPVLFKSLCCFYCIYLSRNPLNERILSHCCFNPIWIRAKIGFAVQ